jgi:tRNA A37 threonylcarbamoyltransferase TsaD
MAVFFKTIPSRSNRNSVGIPTPVRHNGEIEMDFSGLRVEAVNRKRTNQGNAQHQTYQQPNQLLRRWQMNLKLPFFPEACIFIINALIIS